MYVCLCVCVCTRTHVRVRTCMRACMHACMRACVCLCVSMLLYLFFSKFTPSLSYIFSPPTLSLLHQIQAVNETILALRKEVDKLELRNLKLLEEMQREQLQDLETSM